MVYFELVDVSVMGLHQPSFLLLVFSFGSESYIFIIYGAPFGLVA